MKKGETSFKDTNFGILPRQNVVKLETEDNKRGLKYISSLGGLAIRKDIDIPFIKFERLLQTCV